MRKAPSAAAWPPPADQTGPCLLRIKYAVWLSSPKTSPEGLGLCRLRSCNTGVRVGSAVALDSETRPELQPHNSHACPSLSLLLDRSIAESRSVSNNPRLGAQLPPLARSHSTRPLGPQDQRRPICYHHPGRHNMSTFWSATTPSSSPRCRAQGGGEGHSLTLTTYFLLAGMAGSGERESDVLTFEGYCDLRPASFVC